MDKIWYRNPSKSEVIGRCGGDEKTNDHAEPTKSRMLKKIKKINLWCLVLNFLIQHSVHKVYSFGLNSFAPLMYRYKLMWIESNINLLHASFTFLLKSLIIYL